MLVTTLKDSKTRNMYLFSISCKQKVATIKVPTLVQIWWAAWKWGMWKVSSDMWSALAEIKLQRIRMCVMRKIDYCMVQQLRHNLQSLFALKPDTNYKAHSEDMRSRVWWVWFVLFDDRKDFTALSRYGAQNIVKEIKQYQKKWLQHVQRMDRNRLPRQALKYRPEGRRYIGRPKKRWRDQLHFGD